MTMHTRMQCSGEILAFLTPTSYRADVSALIRAPFVHSEREENLVLSAEQKSMSRYVMMLRTES
jgi:hypothetical protein